MSVTVTFECDGCFVVVQGTKPLHRTFRSITGRSHGIGSYTYDTPQDVAPPGWVAHDPYTGCCYCPKCWKEVEDA